MLSQNFFKLRGCAVAVILFGATLLTAQENCANGIDDDGDGLVDLNDLSDCSCSIASNTASLLPNPSLEEFALTEEGCTSRQPGGLPDGTNQANCLVGWQRVSLGTTDAWNAFTLSGSPPSFPASLPQPLPSGAGVAGFWAGIGDVPGNQFRNGDGTVARQYREYLAACLVEGERLVPDRDYRLTFSLGFMKPQKLELSYSSNAVDLASPDSIELGIYGVKQCGQLNFGDFYDCPEASGATGYELITNVIVSGEPGTWSASTVNFTCSSEYEGFAIGGSCADDIARPDGGRYRNYYFIDDLILNETSAFGQPVAGPVSVSGQTVCADEVLLTGRAAAGAGYQWYQDGIAIPGANSVTHLVDPGQVVASAFSLRIVSAAGCAVTDPVRIQRPVIVDQVPDSVALCGSGEAVTIYPVETGGATYSWSDGSTNTYFTVSDAGTYSLTVSIACLEREETFVVAETDHINYRYVTTPENPCEGDTVEVRLETNWYAPLTVYFMPNGEQVFVNGQQPVHIVAGVANELQALFVSSCGIVSDQIPIPVLPKLEISSEVTDLNCTGTTGRIDLQLPAANFDDLQWYGPDGRYQGSNQTLLVDRAGRYTAVVNGAGYCSTSTVFEVTDNGGFDLLIDATDVSCGQDATAMALPSGGTPPYSISWINQIDAPPIAVNSFVAAGLDRGSYLARLSDSKGCHTEKGFTIGGPDPIRASALAGWAGCLQDTSGTITLSVEGGTLPYRYGHASGGREQDGPTFSGLEAGEHFVYATDAFGCATDAIGIGVTSPSPFTIDAGADRKVNWGDSVILDLTVTGVRPGEGKIEWSYSQGPFPAEASPFNLSLKHRPVKTTTYRVSLTTAEGCSKNDSVTVYVDDEAHMYAPNAFSPNGDGINDRFQFYTNRMVREVTDLKVYDRWGGLVWSKPADSPAEWDGRGKGLPMGTGAYVYRGIAVMRDETTRVLSGTVTLLR